jgi:DNA repair protein RecN (Recombination protein N)
MLRLLDIRDLLLIDRAVLEPGPGLTVLTGETGAGKSILLDALGFALGWKGRADVVRAGAAQAEVTAVFQIGPDHPAQAVLDQAGLPAKDELVLRRTASPDGRKQAFVNDRRVGAEVLRDLSDRLVELHGQHDDRGLMDPRGHRALLDAFAGADLTMVRSAWAARRDARAAVAAAEAAVAQARADEDFLRHAVAEIERLSPEPGEDQLLDTRRRQLQAGARVRDEIARALEALGGQGADGLIGDAQRRLTGAAAAAEGGLDPALDALARAREALGEAEGLVELVLSALDGDPGEVERIEERLFAIRALARKHAVRPDDLSAHGAAMAARLAALDDAARDLGALARAVTEADRGYTAAATSLTRSRRAAAERLAQAMAAELPPLRLERARFTVDLAPADPGPEGADQVTFTVATNPGTPAGPLNRIASGGELSRFLLALKLCLTAGQPGQTLIFDEIDRGVGGATADAVGRRLAALGRDAQVLVVTHSPQVAARGAGHWRVEKRQGQGTTATQVLPLTEAERVDELARMLAGDQITEAARGAARALLDAG